MVDVAEDRGRAGDRDLHRLDSSGHRTHDVRLRGVDPAFDMAAFGNDDNSTVDFAVDRTEYLNFTNAAQIAGHREAGADDREIFVVDAERRMWTGTSQTAGIPKKSTVKPLSPGKYSAVTLSKHAADRPYPAASHGTDVR